MDGCQLINIVVDDHMTVKIVYRHSSSFKKG